ncbi:MAG: terminase small subunit [Lawsonibacter sp.]|nr:terminase small subunit [bacterium 210917-SL.2.15]
MTKRQERFIQEYLIDLNAKQAAIRAGYSPKTAQEQASRLLSNVKVQTAIAAFLDGMTSANIADIEEIMKYLTAVMRGEHTEEVLILVGNSVQKITTKQVSAKDRIRAAELLGKRYGLFSDKVKIDNAIPVVIVGDDQLED